MDVALIVARLLLVGVFLVAGTAKLADLAGSRAAVAGFGVPERLASPLGTLLPFAEIAAALLLLDAGTAEVGALAALGLLAAFCIGIAASMARGEAPECHCFGQLRSEPVGGKVLARNLGLAAVAAFVLASGDGPGPDLLPSPDSLDGALAAAIGSVLVAALLIGLGAMAYLQLLRNHGRLLLRVESLEGALRARGIAIPQAVAAAAGLPVGAAAPEFELPNFEGDRVSLAGLRAAGKPVLLVFTDPGCGPCKKLAPQLASWLEEAGRPIMVVPVSRGVREPTLAELGQNSLAASVLLETGMEVSKRYEATATPSGVLVDAAGRIASPLAAGDQAILQLARNSHPPALQVQRAGVPAGPKVGDELPLASEISDLEGNAIDLGAALGGRERLLLFWDPGCGFCSRMLPDLLEWEAHNPDSVSDLLVLSKGVAELNSEQGISAQIVLDQASGVGRGINFRGTPSALRVAADGSVVSDYAVGADAVLALARSASSHPA